MTKPQVFSQSPMFQSDIKSLPFLHRGKVRDIYAVSGDKLLVIQTDRLSAFDVVLDDPIPGKGQALTTLSNFWFAKLRQVVPNHLTNIAPESVVTENERDQVFGRSMVVRRFQPLKIEAIVRGYIIGSGWKDYQKTGSVCGIILPSGLKEAEKLPKVIYTPSNKAPTGQHDANISYEQTIPLVGRRDIARGIRDIAIRLYREAAAYALSKGIIIADTKFEFGVTPDTELFLIDEVLTPDSSRFWPVDQYKTGISPLSFDKQFVRDWLETQPWDKKAPAPRLPPDIIAKTTEKYQEALRRLTS